MGGELLVDVVRGASNLGLLEGGAVVAAFRATDCRVTRDVVIATGEISFGDFFALEGVSSSLSLILNSSDFITIATVIQERRRISDRFEEEINKLMIITLSFIYINQTMIS
jgi:hypothetical protein